MSQLALKLQLEPNARFDTFVKEGSGALVDHLEVLASGGRDETIWVAGVPDAGKTHLLQASCRAAGERGLRTIYVSAATRLPAEAFAGLGSLDLVAIDDVELLAGDPVMERALFSVVNEFYRGRGALLLAASVPPAGAGFVLPDLASRAAGSIVYRLEPLTDAARKVALGQLASERGIDLDDATSAYLLNRVRRDMRAIAQWIELIDRESLAAQRRVTLPFVRELLLRHRGAAGLESPGQD